VVAIVDKQSAMQTPQPRTTPRALASLTGLTTAQQDPFELVRRLVQIDSRRCVANPMRARQNSSPRLSFAARPHR
jgi:hypothetical protein